MKPSRSAKKDQWVTNRRSLLTRLLPKTSELKEIGMHLTKNLFAGIMLGTIPTFIFGNSQETFRFIMNSQLIPIEFIWYFSTILIVQISISLLDKKLNFIYGRPETAFKFILRLLSDMGSPLLSALQAGSGVILGFVLLWKRIEPESYNLINQIEICLIIFTLLLFCSMLTIISTNLINTKQDQNPITLEKKLLIKSKN